ncbi:MAG: L,D-transpeptidase family protein [Peptococcaceae bacterium]
MKVKKIYILICIIMLLVSTGATWPDNLKYLSGADYEQTRQLKLTEPPMIGTDVVELQERLKELGFYTGKIDGIYSFNVVRAVQDFQDDNGLAADGIVKDHIWIRLSDKHIPVSKKQKLPAPQGEVKIIVDTFRLKLIVLNDNEPFKIYPVALGRSSTPTPIGNFKVNHKAVNWGTGFGTRWMGLNVPWGRYGIHGTNKPWSIGRLASHGCVRMRNTDVEEIYPWIKHNTEVIIVGSPFGRLSYNKRTLFRGSRGSDVVVIQEKLVFLGFLQGKADGIFGYHTEKAVKDFQKANNLKITGQIRWNEYQKLNL